MSGGGGAGVKTGFTCLSPLWPNRRRVAVKKFSDFQTDNVLDSFITSITKYFNLFSVKVTYIDINTHFC